MNGVITQRLYAERYKQKMAYTDYLLMITNGLDLMEHEPKRGTVRPNDPASLLMAIEYNNELIVDLLKETNDQHNDNNFPTSFKSLTYATHS